MEESERTLQSETTETTTIPDELVLKTTINELIFKRETLDYNSIDNVEHYGGKDNPYEVNKVLEAWEFLDKTYLWNVLKYIARHNKKGDELENLKKAKYYLDREIERREGARNT